MSLAAIPGPSSTTQMTTWRGRTSPVTRISPPLGEYLIAFEIRFVNTWLSRSSSARIIGKSSGKSTTISWISDWVDSREAIRRTRMFISTSERLIESAPACKREASNRFSINSVRWSASSSMTARLSATISRSQVASSRRRVLTYPLIKATGVFSS